MGRLEYLDGKLKEPIVVYLKLLLSYKKNTPHVFCEGDADCSYYCELIGRLYPEREIHKYVAEGKNNVIKAWEGIDWNDFQKNRVLFFVDRDLSYWVGERQSYDTNVYITDGYSFENDAISPHMFLKLLEDLHGFANYFPDEKKRIRNFYLERWKEFVDGSYDLMGCILYMYISKHEHAAKNINLRNCLDFDADKLWKQNIGDMSYLDYYKKELKIDKEDLTEILSKYKTRFTNESEHYSIRGKWCIVFMIGLMNYVLKNGKYFAPSLYTGKTKKPKKILELSDRGSMAVIGPKMVLPKSLDVFLKKNLMSKSTQ